MNHAAIHLPEGIQPITHSHARTQTQLAPDTSVYPVSWYQVAWSGELRPKQIKSVTLCGRPLVIFRGEDGQVAALDAHCPHLGAHLGVRGKVCGNHIKCGFHSWEFDQAGFCQKTPSLSKITPKMRTKSWRVTEKYGIIFVHFDPFEVATSEELPRVDVLEDGLWGDPIGKTHQIFTRHSDILENGVDMEHFSTVHGVPMNNARLVEDSNGNLRFKNRTITQKLGLSFDTWIEIIYPIPGLQIIHLHSVLGREAVTLSSITPVGPSAVIAHLTTRIRKKRKFSPLTPLITRALSYFINSTFAEDIPIWNAKIFKDRPILAKGDEGISRFRNWYYRYPMVSASER